MTFGNGSLGLIPRPAIPGGGPPFAANSANNGLSVDTVTGQIVLGQDTPGPGLADFLSTRWIEAGGFTLSLTDVATSLDISLGAIGLNMNNPDGSAFLQALSWGMGSNAGIDYNIRTNKGGADQFLIDTQTGQYGMGDLDSANLQNYILINDSAAGLFPSSTSIRNPNGGVRIDDNGFTTLGPDPGFAGSPQPFVMGTWNPGGPQVIDPNAFIEIAITGTIYKIATFI